MAKDACYTKVKSQYKVFPSARASQAIAKCRKSKGMVTKSAKGTALKRWGDEKWVDTRTGKPCGSGGKNEYCRPSKRVSSKTLCAPLPPPVDSCKVVTIKTRLCVRFCQ